MVAPLEKTLVTPSLIEGLNKGEIVVSDVGATIPGVTASNQQRFLLDLARAVAAGSLKPEKLVLALRSAGVESSAKNLGADVADALWYAWQEVEGDAGGDAKGRVADAAKDALKEQLVTKQQLLESGDGEFFEWCGLVVSKDGWRRKEIRTHTKHVYVQRKFNLLREESEGYAKLATLLNQQAAGSLSPANTSAALAEMNALIGYFDLDPNRCVSLVLDAFTNQPHNNAFLGLLPAFSADACSQVLGWHFYRCREDAAVQPPRPAQAASAGLYVVAAKMVQAGYIGLDALMAHLLPDDEDLKKAYAEGQKKMREGISRIGIISLVSAADTAGAAPVGAPPGLGLRRDASGLLSAQSPAAAGSSEAQQQQSKPRTGQTAAVLELAAAPYAAPLTSVSEGNQKLSLLAAFLQIGDWEHAEALMRWLGALGLTDFAAFPDVGRALCNLIGQELQPVYQSAVTGGSLPVLTAGLPQKLLDLLRVAGQHLYHNMSVLTKLVRVLAAALASNGGASPADTRLHEQVLELLTQSVLPAMSLVPGNAALVNEAWAALSHLPYTDRFCLYADLKEGARTSPLLTAAAKLAETEVRRILRRVTAPANKKEAKATMKPLGRMLAKIMHAAPLAVAEQLIRQVMGMPGMVTSIVESLKYLTPMAFDVMTFAVLKQLASPKKKLKDDGMNLEEWYQWLAAFTGLLCKKHSEVEVVALLQYVANQLKSCESLDLLVLKEMVQTMTGHQAVFEVSEHQLDALAGSDTLKAEIITQGEHRSSDKSLQRASARLLAALQAGDSQEQRLAMPLLMLLAQQRKLIVLQSQSTHLKLIAELYDKCQEVCMQYAEFLQHALSLSEYAALLPSMEELATEYCIDPELVFALYRPLIRDVEPPAAAGPDNEEEGEIAAGGGTGEQQRKGAGAAGDATAAAAGQGVCANGAEPMEEEGEVAASPRSAAATSAKAEGANGQLSAPAGSDPAAMAQRWEALEQQVKGMHAGSPAWRGMTPTLYTTFWALQLYDLEVPVARYEATIAQLRTDIRIAQGDIETAKRDAQRPPAHYGGYGFRGPGGAPEVAVGPAVDVDQLQKDIERAQAALDKLPGELKAQQANAAAVERRLQREKGAWVAEGGRGYLPREFVQHCVLPRMLNSPTDALYCARFLKKVHQLDVPGFSLLNTINFVMREFGFLVRVCTSREATNFGIFLNEVFAMVERWRSAEVFGRECATANTFKLISDKPPAGRAKPAAAAKAKPEAAAGEAAQADGGKAAGENGAAEAGKAPAEGAEGGADAAKTGEAAAAAEGGAGAAGTAPPSPAPGPASGPAAGPRNVDHREWLNLCANWQRKLTDEVFSSCLRSRDYMQAKNALLALNRCVKVYPAIKHDANQLIELLKPIRDKDPREDLKTLARMYCTALEMQMRDKARNMVGTREEYAGKRPPKKLARPATSKAAAAASGGKPPAAGKEAGSGADKGATEAQKGAGTGGEKKAAVSAGKDGERKPAAEAGKAAAGEGPTAAGAAAVKEEGSKRAADSSRGPALPPGMGVARQQAAGKERGEQQAGAGKEQERRQEGRPAVQGEGPPPGFGAADKLRHAGSSTDVRRNDHAAAGAGGTERGQRDKERRDRPAPAPASDRPPRPGGRLEEAAGAGSTPREQREKGEAGSHERRGSAALRPDAAPFVPRDGSRHSSGSARPAEEPAAGEREAKRARREEVPAGGSSRDRDKERGDHQRAGDGGREREARTRERQPVPEAAKEPAAGGREDRPGSGSRRRGKEDESARAPAAAEALAEAGRDRDGRPERQTSARDSKERPAIGGRDREGGRPAAAAEAAGGRREEEGRREHGHASKRKREDQAPEVAAGAAATSERPTGRTADARDRQQGGDRERDRSSAREQQQRAAKEREEREAVRTADVARAAPAGSVPEQQERPRRARIPNPEPPAAAVEDARAAAKAAAAAREREKERGKDRAAATAERAAPAAAVSPAKGETGGSSGSDDGQGRGERRHKRDRKEKEKDKDKKKKERKEKKHRRKDRSSERPSQQHEAPEPEGAPAPAPAAPPERRRQPVAAPPVKEQQQRQQSRAEEEERGSKRRRQEESPELPARLRGRLGGTSLLGAALKDIGPEGEGQAPAQRHQQAHAQPGQRQEEPQLARDDARWRLRRGVSGGDPREQQRGRGREQGEEYTEREVREVREVRRGGRSRR